MIKKRIQVYADEEIKRRVELAAAKHRVAVTEYCLTAIEQRLAEDDVLERQQIQIAVKQPDENDLLPELEALHGDVLRYRDGEPLDVDCHLIAVREERDDELLGLR